MYSLPQHKPKAWCASVLKVSIHKLIQELNLNIIFIFNYMNFTRNLMQRAAVNNKLIFKRLPNALNVHILPMCAFTKAYRLENISFNMYGFRYNAKHIDCKNAIALDYRNVRMEEYKNKE